MSGLLYIVPTPVGNLQDMTPRAVEVLRSVDRVLAEDTRTSRVLMDHFGITTPMSSHHKFNEHATAAAVAAELEAGAVMALVSDAGTPGISDPGFMLARECRQRGVPVVTLPGPTALVPALVDSGLPCDRFTFEGFLPPKKGRDSRLKALAQEQRTVVLYESPLRLLRTLQALADACGPSRRASVSREISKVHEQTVRGTLSELVDHFTQQPPRGEIVIVVEGAQADRAPRVHRNKYAPAAEDPEDTAEDAQTD